MMKAILLIGAATLLCVSAAVAQDNNNRRPDDRRGGEDRGRWDPAQFQQRIMDGVKERLEITDEAEWKAIQPLVEKVMNVNRQIMGDRMRGMMGRRGGESDRGRGVGGNTQPDPSADALQRAVDAKASKTELKAAMDKYVASRKAKQAELEAAQADLRKVLTPRQEAIATLTGLL